MRSGKDRRRARERDRKREKRNRKNGKYGQVKRKHSRKGSWSCVISVIVTAILVSLIVMAFMNKGKSVAMVGSFGLFDMILACIGIVTAVRGFKERDKNYLTCKIGIVINGLVLLALILVFIRGCV